MAAMAAAAAIATTSSTVPNRAYADSPFRFNPFSSPSPSVPSSSSESPQTDSSESDAKDSSEDSRGGFNPESLERGAKALREINSSPYHKQVSAFFVNFPCFFW